MDWKGRNVELGLIAGGLINEADWNSQDLTPDIERPINSDIFGQFTSKKNILLAMASSNFNRGRDSQSI